jgi:hypothetical protein
VRRDGGRWEVLNAGVEGYNTVTELAWLETRGLALRPRTVVVGFNLNDFDDAPVIGPLGVLTRDRSQRVAATSLASRSELWLLLRWLAANWRRNVPDLEQLGPGPTERFGALDLYASARRKQYWAHPNDGRWQAMVDALAGLRRVTDAHGLRLVVAVIPDGDQIAVPAPDLRPQVRLAAVCREIGVDCLDLHPAFAADGGEKLHLDTMHPSAAGQRIVARAVAAHLLGGAPHSATTRTPAHAASASGAGGSGSLVTANASVTARPAQRDRSTSASAQRRSSRRRAGSSVARKTPTAPVSASRSTANATGAGSGVSQRSGWTT